MCSGGGGRSARPAGFGADVNAAARSGETYQNYLNRNGAIGSRFGTAGGPTGILSNDAFNKAQKDLASRNAGQNISSTAQNMGAQNSPAAAAQSQVADNTTSARRRQQSFGATGNPTLLGGGSAPAAQSSTLLGG